MLEIGDGVAGPGVFLAAQPQLIDAARIEHIGIERGVAISLRVAAHRFLRHFRQTHAFDAGGGASEIGFDEGARQPNRVEDLRAAV